MAHENGSAFRRLGVSENQEQFSRVFLNKRGPVELNVESRNAASLVKPIFDAYVQNRPTGVMSYLEPRILLDSPVYTMLDSPSWCFVDGPMCPEDDTPHRTLLSDRAL